ncbi:putative olfactory receptor 52P1 [Scleropages formosus]|uniref:putative olfactory receptor 52P1 n=1 Tax=Scleropages formosus TaxID=113540 RepID=UPI0008791ED0|nr:putative olfactory receptor 52P1 [Scleropages formosus]XP_029111403.1 putative olfactory receptor 52P1 [Scleropages formosus]
MSSNMQEYTVRNLSYTDFILIGFSGPREWRQLLFIPFFIIFVISVITNIILMSIILSNRVLHSPMCLLICAMSFVDLTIIICCVPHMLFSLLLNWNHISLLGCLVQMFFVHAGGGLQSTIFMWMALDRYFAICAPLRYNEHMSCSAFLKFVLVPVLRNVIFVLAVISLAGSLSYCQSNEIDHCFCEHMALVTLACGSIRINNILGLAGTFCVPAVDFLLVTASYIKIFVSVFRSGKSSQKALSTCITHIMVITVSLIFVLTSYLSYRGSSNFSSNIRAVISTMYLLIPGCFNPVIYGIRTKEIRLHMMKALKCGKITPSH